jgi:hypothetical protein
MVNGFQNGADARRVHAEHLSKEDTVELISGNLRLESPSKPRVDAHQLLEPHQSQSGTRRAMDRQGQRTGCGASSPR